jgi:hypothetical protein
MFDLSNTIFFSTELQPQDNSVNIKDWWYLIPETGQHVSFYTTSSFKEIARVFEAKYFTNNMSLHILTKEDLGQNPFSKRAKNMPINKNIFQRVIRKLDTILNKPNTSDNLNPAQDSLTSTDFEFVKHKLQSQLEKK